MAYGSVGHGVAGLLEAAAPEEIGGIDVVHRLGEPSAEENKVPLDQRIDESLVPLCVELLLIGAPRRRMTRTYGIPASYR